MIYALYNDFGEIFCVAHNSKSAYDEASEYLKEKSENEEQYTGWLLDLKYNYNKNPRSYGVFGIVWVKGEDKNIVE